MKKKFSIGTVIYLVVAALAIVGVIALVVYDVSTKKTLETETLMKGILVLATLIFSMLRVFGVGTRAPSHKLLRQHYSEQIGNAFEKDPKREKLFLRAVADYDQSRYHRALRRLDSLEGRFSRGEELHVIHLFQALCYDRMGEVDSAISFYGQAFKLKQTSTIMSNLGTCYEKKGDKQAAIDAYGQAIQLNPNNAYPFNNLAQLYLVEGEYEGALVYAEQAISLKNNLYQAHSAKAMCYALMGDKAAYEAALQQAIFHGADRAAIEYAVRVLRVSDTDGEQDEEQDGDTE